MQQVIRIKGKTEHKERNKRKKELIENKLVTGIDLNTEKANTKAEHKTGRRRMQVRGFRVS